MTVRRPPRVSIDGFRDRKWKEQIVTDASRPAGPQGPMGPAGARGATGDTGAAGPQGVQGEPGQVSIVAYVFDGGEPESSYSNGPAFDCGEV
jgi:hypothetical protein